MNNIFPKAVNPPKLVKSYGDKLGYVAASILIVMSIIHLFRIDTLIPIIDQVLPGGSGWATTFVIAVILMEVFALPFLFRLKLSPLAHIMSGAFIVLAPLMWTLLAVWAYGSKNSIGLVGQFTETPSSLFLIALCLLWIALNFITLWTLGYNNLKVKDLVKPEAPSSKKPKKLKK